MFDLYSDPFGMPLNPADLDFPDPEVRRDVEDAFEALADLALETEAC